MKYQRVALIGTGMIGGSLAAALKQADVVARLVGADRSLEVAERARAHGLIDEVAPGAAEAVAGADLVLLAVPVRATGAVCEAIAKTVAPEVLVTDVGSTKLEVLAAVARALPHPERFVGAHPIAGTERSGPDAADAALFRGKRCILTPAPGARQSAVDECARLWSAAGAQVERMDPSEHDRVLAFVSHLPHAAAFALAATVGEGAGDSGLSGGGFADTTRIAASDAHMWRDVFLSNRDALLDVLERFELELGQLRRAIASGDGDALLELLQRAKRARERVLRGGR